MTRFLCRTFIRVLPLSRTLSLSYLSKYSIRELLPSITVPPRYTGDAIPGVSLPPRQHGSLLTFGSCLRGSTRSPKPTPTTTPNHPINSVIQPSHLNPRPPRLENTALSPLRPLNHLCHLTKTRTHHQQRAPTTTTKHRRGKTYRPLVAQSPSPSHQRQRQHLRSHLHLRHPSRSRSCFQPSLLLCLARGGMGPGLLKPETS
jgi:hypothetical protein